MVRLASRMFSAISLGVFCRLAPSTRAIIRSMKLSPGLAVISHDDAVGEHLGAAGDRAPVAAGLADDRGGLAGDRRLVDAGDTLDDVAVAGDDLPGHDDDPVAELQLRSPGRPRVPSTQPWASVSVLARRRVAACALPRPSATASARLANTTVSQSQATTAQAKTLGSVKANTVERTAPTSTTNMTGLRTMTRGSSLRSGVRQRGEQHLGVEQPGRDALGRRGLR